MSGRNGNPIDTLVADCFYMATEAILQERKAQLRPITNASQSFPDYIEYVRQVLASWKRQINSPLTLDLYLFVPKNNEHVLLERWNFSYQLHADLKDNRPFSFINRRVQTLLRSLYCFVRMLPGFNMLPLSSQKPLISFQLYNDQRISPSSFKHEVSKYQFAKISTSKGLLSIAVTFLNSSPVKSMIKSISGGVLTGVPSSSTGSSSSVSSTPVAIRRDSKTAAIPIPQQASSYEGGSGGMNRQRTVSDSKEHHRRSFQIPTEMGSGSLTRQEFARSYEGKSSSIPTSNMMDAAAGSSNSGNAIYHSSPFRPSDPSHLFGSSPIIPIKHSPTSGTSPSQFGLFGYPPPPAPSTSHDSRSTPVGSYSTPPFAFQQYMEERNSEGSGGSRNNSTDLMTGASPPFPQFSSSLTSTSPHFPSFLNSMSAERKNSFRKSSINTPNNMAPSTMNALSINSSNPNSTHISSTGLPNSQNNMHAGLLPAYDANNQALITTTPEWEQFKARLTLPSSPFALLSKSRQSNNMALVPGNMYSNHTATGSRANSTDGPQSRPPIYGKSALATLFNNVDPADNNNSNSTTQPDDSENFLFHVPPELQQISKQGSDKRRYSGTLNYNPSSDPTFDDNLMQQRDSERFKNDADTDRDEDLPFAFNPNELSASILAKRDQPQSDHISTVEVVVTDIKKKLSEYRQFISNSNINIATSEHNAR